MVNLWLKKRKISFNIFLKIIIIKNFNLLYGKNKIFFFRSSIVFNLYFLFELFIHKGNYFKKILIFWFFFFFKLGEFSFTRKPFQFQKKKKNVLKR